MPYRVCLLIILLCVNTIFGAENENIDIADYQNIFMSEDEVNDSVFYPDYFRDVDRLSYRNIIAEFKFRLEFIAGLRPRPSFLACFEHQGKITAAVNNLKQNQGRLGFKRIDDALLNSENSPLKGLVKSPGRRLSLNCSYQTIGNLEESGTIYCTYHGPSHSSPFHKQNIDRFMQARPILTAFDLVELMIFLPALISLPIIWLITKKLLEKKSQPH